MESDKTISLILKLTKITSDNLKAAIYDHFVKDYSISQSSAINCVPQPKLTNAVKRLNEIAEIANKISHAKYTS